MFNVWALQKANELNYGSGQYRSLVMLPIDQEPETDVSGYEWVLIGRRVSEDEAEKVMNQYTSVSRAKC